MTLHCWITQASAVQCKFIQCGHTIHNGPHCTNHHIDHVELDFLAGATFFSAYR